MTDAESATRSSRLLFRIGWIVLIVVFALFAVNHLAGIWFIASSTDEAQMFEAFAATNLLALVLLAIPYRRREWWAWLALWIAIVPIVLVIAFVADGIGVTYAVTGAVLALAQLATLPSFRAAASA